MSLLIAPTLLMCSGAHAEGRLALGAATAYSQSIYKDYDALVLPLPMVSYEGKTFYFHGVSTGFYLFNNDQQQLSLDLRYSPRKFDPKDSDDEQLKFLRKRHSTMLLGARYRWRSDVGELQASLHFDALDETDGGIVGQLSYGYPFALSSQLSITPSVGVDWHNKDFNDYYYHVSNSEAAASGLNAYHADSGIDPFASLAVNYMVSKKVATRLSLRYTRLSDEITDSPMVDRDGIYSVSFSAVYQF